jgi:hypothetical protein
MSNTRDDDVGRQYNVFQHQHQVTVAQRPHDAGQRSDLEQRTDMRQQHAIFHFITQQHFGEHGL